MYLFVFIFHFKLSTLSNQSENHPHDRSFESKVKHAKMYMCGVWTEASNAALFASGSNSLFVR